MHRNTRSILLSALCIHGRDRVAQLHHVLILILTSIHTSAMLVCCIRVIRVVFHGATVTRHVHERTRHVRQHPL
jgi:hypothetical protein